MMVNHIQSKKKKKNLHALKGICLFNDGKSDTK